MCVATAQGLWSTRAGPRPIRFVLAYLLEFAVEFSLATRGKDKVITDSFTCLVNMDSTTSEEDPLPRRAMDLARSKRRGLGGSFRSWSWPGSVSDDTVQEKRHGARQREEAEARFHLLEHQEVEGHTLQVMWAKSLLAILEGLPIFWWSLTRLRAHAQGRLKQ